MTGAEAMVCRELVELATDYLEGALSAERQVLLEEHLAACDGCSTYVEQLRETVRLALDPRRLELEPWHRTELLAAFRAGAAWADRRVNDSPRSGQPHRR